MDKNRLNDLQTMHNSASVDEIMLSQDSGISLDILSWLLKIAKYWYLFIITIVVAFGLAYVKNKSWTPTYKTATNLLIQDARMSSLRNDFTSGYQGLGMGGMRSHTNQMIMYQSYDFVSKVVDSLGVNYDIYAKHRFKDDNYYAKSPVYIKSDYIASRAHGLEFEIKGIDENSYSISFAGESESYMDKFLRRNYKPLESFEVVGNYGEPLQHSFFFLTIDKTNLFTDPAYDLYLKFMPKGALINNYKGRLQTQLMENSSVLEISMVGKIAQRDVDFLNLLNREFSAQNLEYKNRSAESSIDFLDSQLAVILDSINSSESVLSEFQKTTGMYSQNISVNKSQLVHELENKRNELNLRKQYMDHLRRELTRTDGLLTDPSALGVSNSRLSALVVQYNDLVQSTRSLGPRSPILAKNKDLIEDLKTQIENNIQAMNDTYELEKGDLQSRLSKAQGEVASMPKHERDLLTKERNFTINQTYYNYLLQRRLESQLQKASNAADNIIIDVPRTMGVTNGGEKQGTYMLFGIIGLLIPLAFVLCKEILFKYSIQTREELERISKLPVIGTIEHSKRKEFLAVRKYPRSSFSEGFRNLRSRMEFIAKKEKPVSMLITSTEPKDGKTFIAVNMASIYHISNRKVILIDFDLRRPMLTKSLGLENRKGLSNYLISQVELKDIIYTHPELDIDIIPAGATPPNPSELIHSDKTKEMLQTLYTEYDYVILDCSPIGLVSDGHFLARLVDVMMYVVRNEKTNRNFFKYTIRELLEDNINNIALVYNDVDIQSGYYGSRRYYGKSSYYLKHNSYYNNEEEGE